MNKKKIIFLTGTRADFGKLKSLISIISNNDLFDMHIFVTGMHLNSKFGRTVDEIIKCGFKNIYQFINHDDVSRMDRVLSKTVDGFSHYVSEIDPDIIVVHGDRPEALAGAIVGSFNNRIVVHIEGGELSGTIDDSIRHAITKLAHVHMVANEQAQKRLVQLGEKNDSIFIIGSPDLDLMNPVSLPDLDEVKNRYEIHYDNYSICMFHPVTTEYQGFELYAKHYFDALKASQLNYVVIYPNNDLGSDVIIKEIESLRGLPNFKIFPSLRFEYFLRLLHDCDFIIGNSSAGVREAPFYNVQTINVGTRQNNRSFSSSISNCNYDVESILNTIQDISKNRKPVADVERMHFGDGNSDDKFLEILLDSDFLSLSRQKHFQEIDL